MVDMPVRLAAPDPTWRESFVGQREGVARVLARWLAATVQHVGSTAVPGLPAKPIVDLMAPVVVLPRIGSPERAAMVDALTKDGWTYWSDDPHAATRLWFLRPSPELRTHHLHVVEFGGPRAHALVAFRDALTRDPAVAADYADLKRRLAAEYPEDREAYTAGKGAFVAQVLGYTVD
ncbi:GrpB family protein [Streptodolium elevatio]